MSLTPHAHIILQEPIACIWLYCEPLDIAPNPPDPNNPPKYKLLLESGILRNRSFILELKTLHVLFDSSVLGQLDLTNDAPDLDAVHSVLLPYNTMYCAGTILWAIRDAGLDLFHLTATGRGHRAWLLKVAHVLEQRGILEELGGLYTNLALEEVVDRNGVQGSLRIAPGAV